MTINLETDHAFVRIDLSKGSQISREDFDQYFKDKLPKYSFFANIRYK